MNCILQAVLVCLTLAKVLAVDPQLPDPDAMLEKITAIKAQFNGLNDMYSQYINSKVQISEGEDGDEYYDDADDTDGYYDDGSQYEDK